MFTRIFKITRKNPDLGVSLRRKTLGFSHIEASLYAIMVGCAEVFALYYAVKRGLDKSQLALLSTVPIVLGSISNWLVPQNVKNKHLKKALLTVVFIQLIGVLGLFHSVGEADYFKWILVSLSLYWIGGMAAGPMWIDWMSGWLPKEKVGRYLSKRNGFTSLITVIAYLSAASFIYRNDEFSQYQFVFGAAFCCRSLSWLILFFQPQPTVIENESSKAFGLLKALQSKPIWLMILFTVLFRFVASVASPFFLPYMVNELHFSLLDYAWITAIPFLSRSLFLVQWGEAARSFRPIIGTQIAMFLLSLVCLLWTYTSNLTLLTFIEGFSGIAWAGIEFCGLVILYGFAPRKARGLVGFHMAFFHFATMLGALVGSELLRSGMTSIELFRLSSVLRLIVGIAFVTAGYHIADIKVSPKHYGKFLMMALSLRSSIFVLSRILPLPLNTRARTKQNPTLIQEPPPIH
jgi:MFS family permease